MPSRETNEKLMPDTPAEEDALAGILKVLLNADHVDFSHYRQTTVFRRLARRISFRNQTSYGEYLTFLENNPDEVELLYDDLLLSYTRFFRDASAFDMLKRKVFPDLAKNKSAKSPIRIWVPGCSTGEEVYSLVICLREFLEEKNVNAAIHIFGTDLSARHIARARKGSYSDEIRKHVSAEQLERFFDRSADGWTISKHIREHCVFAVQDMTQDPPFPNMDIVSCRNVLIYFDAVFLDRSIPMFHFALNSGGFLMLGSSETLSRHAHLFTAVDQKTNLYKKCVSSAKTDYRFPSSPPAARRVSQQTILAATAGANKTNADDGDLVAQIDKVLLESYAPPGVLVDNDMRIRQFCGHVAPYLDPAVGEASLKLSRMTREGLAPDIYIALQESKKAQEKIRKPNVTFKWDDNVVEVDLCVMPLSDPATGETLYLVLFEEPVVPFGHDAAVSTGQGAGSDRDSEELLRLKQEIQIGKTHLQAVIEDKESVNQQLLAANEEVQSTNEELRSVNEEMEAGKEELESSNEELLTLNEELCARNTELGEARKEYQTLFDEMLVGVAVHEIICDKRGKPVDYRFLSINPAFESLTGLKAKDVVGKTVREVMPGIESHWIETYGRVALTGEPVHFENYSKELGKHFDVTAFRPRANQFACAFSDVTESKMANDALRDSESQLRLLVENMGDTVSRHLPDSTITYISKSCKNLLGFSPDELLDKRAADFVHPQDIDATIATIENATELRDDRYCLRHRLRRKDGEYIWVETIGRLVYAPDGSLFEIQCSLRDIRERKRLELHERELQERLADAERRESLGVLAGGVAHDLNNILGPIVALPVMIDEVLEDPKTATDEEIAEARKDLEMIADSARRGAAVISDLNALGRRGHIDMRPMDVNQVVRDCLDTHDIEALCKEHPRVRVDYRLSYRGLTVFGNKTDLHRVLLNLIINALEAVSKRGRVMVEAMPVFLPEQKFGYEVIEPGNYVVIHVRDTGEGIPDALLSRVFEPFVTSKKESCGASGSGLGLSVVHAIMKDHDGYLDVERNLEKWSTTFSLYLPALADDVRRDCVDAKDTPWSRGTEHVLVVDDEPGQRFIVRRGLERLGYTIAEAKNGHEAMDLLRLVESVDLILLDMIMEAGFDGLDTLEAVLKLYPDKKVIIASGHSPETRGRAAQDLGADWLAKPYTINDLAQAVRKRLDRESV